ncbi:hypothetical protein [Phenylobacterium sp.]|uniref:hypothetical protein n=1 Tax=Phenylobacterium sp. TaxID=1871053 RepID=UPI003936E0D2
MSLPAVAETDGWRVEVRRVDRHWMFDGPMHRFDVINRANHQRRHFFLPAETRPERVGEVIREVMEDCFPRCAVS